MRPIWRPDLWESDWYGERAGVSPGTGAIVGLRIGVTRWHFALHFLPQLLLRHHRQAKTKKWWWWGGRWHIERDGAKGGHEMGSEQWTMVDLALQLPLPRSFFLASLCPGFFPSAVSLWRTCMEETLLFLKRYLLRDFKHSPSLTPLATLAQGGGHREERIRWKR